MEIVLNENIKIAQFIDIILRDYIKLLQENRILKEMDIENIWKKQKEVIDKINLIIKGIAYGGNEDYYMENFSKINELLNEVSE